MGRIEQLSEYTEIKDILNIATERKSALECELGVQRCAQHDTEAKGIPRVHPSDSLPARATDELKADHDTRDAMRPLIEALCTEYVQRWNIWAMRALQGLVGFGGGDPIRSDRWYHDMVKRGLTRAGAGLTHFLEIGVEAPSRHFPTDVDAARSVLQGMPKGDDTLT